MREPNGETQNYDGYIRFSIATDGIVKNIQKYKNEQLADFGLRSMHLTFLYCLDRSSEGMTPGELAKTCSVDKALISRITAELRTLGYIDYADGHEEARYKKRLSLTDTGRHVMQSVNEKVRHAVEKISDGISRDQIETFYTVLAMLDQNLQSLAAPAT